MTYGDLKTRLNALIGRTPETAVFEMVTADINRELTLVADLEDDSDENSVLTEEPSIYVFGALSYHGAIIGHPNAGMWTSIYNEKLRAFKAADGSAMYDGGNLKITPAHGTP